MTSEKSSRLSPYASVFLCAQELSLESVFQHHPTEMSPRKAHYYDEGMEYLHELVVGDEVLCPRMIVLEAVEVQSLSGDVVVRVGQGEVEEVGVVQNHYYLL